MLQMPYLLSYLENRELGQVPVQRSIVETILCQSQNHRTCMVVVSAKQKFLSHAKERPQTAGGKKDVKVHSRASVMSQKASSAHLLVNVPFKLRVV